MAFAMWATKLAALLVGLLVMVPESMQSTLLDPRTRSAIQRVNEDEGPFIGLVLGTNRDVKLLKNSTYFVASESVPSITIAGRKFYFGTLKEVPVIYIYTQGPLVSIGVSVQILLDHFSIKGIISYGGAGTVSNQVFLADVIVPSAVAYTGNWKWQKYEAPLEASSEALPSLKIGDYNVPSEGENLLGSIDFQASRLYKPTNAKKDVFYFPVHPEWVKLASTIKSTTKGVTLQGCDHALCGRLGKANIAHGGNVGSGDVYLLNTAYAEFLKKKLNVTAVDSESWAVVSTAVANGVPHIVFRGASTRPGLDYDQRLSEIASKNVLNVVAQFIELIKPSAYSIVNVNAY